MKKELELRTKQVALEVIRLISQLPRTKDADILGQQLLRSGTSIGANYREANRAFSHDDFIRKISICEKEAAQTGYWLELLAEANLAQKSRCERVRKEAEELLAIFVASGRTAKSRR